MWGKRWLYLPLRQVKISGKTVNQFQVREFSYARFSQRQSMRVSAHEDDVNAVIFLSLAISG